MCGLTSLGGKQDANEWKERGTGDMKLLQHKESRRIRVVMRRDKTLKVCANHYGSCCSPTISIHEIDDVLVLSTVMPDMKMTPNVGSDRSWVWSVAADVSEGTPSAETLAVRFANSDNANAFKAAFEKAQADNAALFASSSSTDEAPPTATTASADETKEVAATEDKASGLDSKLSTLEIKEPAASSKTAEDVPSNGVTAGSASAANEKQVDSDEVAQEGREQASDLHGEKMRDAAVEETKRRVESGEISPAVRSLSACCRLSTDLVCVV